MVYIYVLQLKSGKYYVGKTSTPEFRIKSHFNASGSLWTKKYSPLKIIDLIPDCDNFDEDKYTIKYMEKFGIDNVRGGSYTRFNLDKSTKNLINKNISSATDKCFNCGKTGHFSNNCEMYDKHLEFLSISNEYESADEIEIDSSDEEFTIEEIEEYFKTKNIDRSYQLYGKTYIWYDETLWEKSPHERIGARDGTIYSSQFEYIRPIKKYTKKSNKCEKGYIQPKKYTNKCNKCYRCGRSGHFANSCYAKRHLKGYCI